MCRNTLYNVPSLDTCRACAMLEKHEHVVPYVVYMIMFTAYHSST
jgi:hypothetical protein